MDNTLDKPGSKFETEEEIKISEAKSIASEAEDVPNGFLSFISEFFRKLKSFVTTLLGNVISENRRSEEMTTQLHFDKIRAQRPIVFEYYNRKQRNDDKKLVDTNCLHLDRLIKECHEIIIKFEEIARQYKAKNAEKVCHDEVAKNYELCQELSVKKNKFKTIQLSVLYPDYSYTVISETYLFYDYLIDVHSKINGSKTVLKALQEECENKLKIKN